jgi:hypothetical protein
MRALPNFIFLISFSSCYISDSQTPYLHVQPFFFLYTNKQTENEFRIHEKCFIGKKNTHNNNKMNKNIERIFGEIVPFSGFLFWLGKRTNQRGITAHTKEEDGRGHAPTRLIAYYRWDKTAASLSFS